MNDRLWLLRVVVLSGLSLSRMTADSLPQQGVMLFEQRRYGDAALVFRRAMFSEERFSPELRLWVIKSLILSGQLPEAEKLSRLLLARSHDRLAGGHQELIYLLARNLFLQNRMAESQQVFSRLIREDPNHPFAIQSYYWLAEILRRRGLRDEAEQIFWLLLDSFPHHKLTDVADRGLMLVDTARIKEQALLAREEGRE